MLVSAVNDAIKYNERFLESETIQDISDYEDHLLSLENFQGWLEDEYKKLESANPDLIPYDRIVRKKP
ncbi:hypothetical protein NBRC116495_17120 [Aurantivibrio plasticivorans]